MTTTHTFRRTDAPGTPSATGSAARGSTYSAGTVKDGGYSQALSGDAEPPTQRPDTPRRQGGEECRHLFAAEPRGCHTELRGRCRREPPHPPCYLPRLRPAHGATAPGSLRRPGGLFGEVRGWPAAPS